MDDLVLAAHADGGAERFGTAPDGSPVLLERTENGGTRAALTTLPRVLS